jgi:endonuclease/exonuclease/phosphatase family metal-dependent hydrolase
MLTFSRYDISSSLRRSLPIETSLMKLVDLDRCYSVSRVETESGRELVLYTVHLSAYTSDGTIATDQLKMLLADMSSEYEKGNYVVAGGDFNKDLLGNSSEYFGVSGEEYTWAQAFPVELLEGTGFSLIGSTNAPSCRNADAPYHPEQFVLTVDGFIVSDNVTVVEYHTVENGFEYSDHNPVAMTFKLN